MHNTVGRGRSMWACACNTTMLTSSPSGCTPGTQGMEKRCEPFLMHRVAEWRLGRKTPNDCDPGETSCTGLRSILMAANMCRMHFAKYICATLCAQPSCITCSCTACAGCRRHTYLASSQRVPVWSDLHRLGLKWDHGCNSCSCAGHMGAGAEQKGG